MFVELSFWDIIIAAIVFGIVWGVTSKIVDDLWGYVKQRWE